jgi:hypothetical protein
VLQFVQRGMVVPMRTMLAPGLAGLTDTAALRSAEDAVTQGTF